MEEKVIRAIKAMMLNELYGMQKRDGKMIDDKYINSFANRVVDYVHELQNIQ